MKQWNKRKTFFTTLALLAASALAIVALTVWVEVGSVQVSSFVFDSEGATASGDGIRIELTRGKPWQDSALHRQTPVGAQYDWTVFNDTNAEFTDWSVEIYFTEQPILDSSWNGIFLEEERKITYYPTASDAVDLTTVFPLSTRTFGAVLYTTEDVLPERVIVTGYWHSTVFINPLFWILLVIFFVLLFFTLLNFLLWHRTERYRRQLEKDDEMVRQAMLTMTDFIDAKDSYTRGHSSRVAVYSTELAKRLGMPEEERKNLYYIALMHDCGKVGVPDAVLKKPGRLTDDEFRLIQAHASVGNHLLAHFTTIPGISDGAHYHHERYDGSGYPEGLKGEEIPYYARIICIADAVDAMSTNRCYRDRLTEEIMIRELNENAGKQFDPALVPPMIELIHEGIIDRAQKDYPNRG